MKIGPIYNPFQAFPGLRTKRSDGDGGSARQQYDPNQSKRDPDSQDSDTNPENLPQKVTEAIESFQADEATVANGLKASIEGHGPGLRIILKDINGGVVRQFTGEEFLKLRSAAAPGAHRNGKILDQKL